MKSLLFLGFVTIFGFGLSGCFYAGVTATKIVEDATESQASKQQAMARLTAQYQATEGDTSFLRQKFPGASVDVGQFESFEPGLNRLMCRIDGYVRPPREASFAAYIRSGIVSELQAAGVYSEGAPVVLTGKLEEISFSSMLGHWNLSLNVTSSNGHSLSIAEKYEFKSGFGGQAACNDTRDAFVPAVHSLVSKLIRDPGFPALLERPSSGVDK